MALARLALRNLKQRLSSPSSPLLRNEVLGKRLMATAASDQVQDQGRQGGNKEVSVSEKKSSKMSPRRKSGRRSLWRRTGGNDFVPSVYDFFPSGLGNALFEATENINRLFENANQLIGRVKEQDDCYKVRYEVPGLNKDDVKITVDDGVLNIKGEHKEEEQEGSPDDDDYWSAKSYGYYNTSIALPEDAKVEEIKAELKDGVLSVVIPRSEKVKKDVREITVN